jgi:hypothetical protein
MRPSKDALDPSTGHRPSARRRKPAPATGSEPPDTALLPAPATGPEIALSSAVGLGSSSECPPAPATGSEPPDSTLMLAPVTGPEIALSSVVGLGSATGSVLDSTLMLTATGSEIGSSTLEARDGKGCGYWGVDVGGVCADSEPSVSADSEPSGESSGALL